ncbi:hypothetical protein Trydic_g17237 [Trypoxylus dichotomus]
MPVVIVCYGPYKANGFIKHRIQRLYGLLKGLTKNEYEVEVVRSIQLNRLRIEMAGSIIYQCDIRNLLFNINYEDDIFTQQIVKIVAEATTRIYANKNDPKFVTSRESQLYLEKYRKAAEKEDGGPFAQLINKHQEYLRKQNSREMESSQTDNGDDSSELSDRANNVNGIEYNPWDLSSSAIENTLTSQTSTELLTLSDNDR